MADISVPAKENHDQSEPHHHWLTWEKIVAKELPTLGPNISTSTDQSLDYPFKGTSVTGITPPCWANRRHLPPMDPIMKGIDKLPLALCGHHLAWNAAVIGFIMWLSFGLKCGHHWLLKCGHYFMFTVPIPPWSRDTQHCCHDWAQTDNRLLSAKYNYKQSSGYKFQSENRFR